MLRILRSIHAWTGAIVFIFIALMAFTGALSVFRGQMVRMTVPAAKAEAPPASTYGAALAALDIQEPGRLQSVKFSPYDLGVHSALLSGGQLALIDKAGKIVDRSDDKSPRLEELILRIHHTFSAGEKGELFAGLIGAIAFVMLVVGLVISLPALRAFRFRLWPKSMARRDLIASHRDLALVLAIFMALQIPTGVALIFKTELRKALNAGTPAPKVLLPGNQAADKDWTKIIAAAQETFPGARIRGAVAARSPDKPYVVSLQQKGELNPEGGTKVYLAANGYVLGKVDGKALSKPASLFNSLLALHSGVWGGVVTRTLTLLTGLGLSILALIGALSFFRSLKGGRKTL